MQQDNTMSDDIDDGLLPFADRRFRRDELVDQPAPAELAQFLEREINLRGVDLPHDGFLELRCVSQDFAAAVFMVRRDPSGELRMLVPQSAIRKPN